MRKAALQEKKSLVLRRALYGLAACTQGPLVNELLALVRLSDDVLIALDHIELDEDVLEERESASLH